MIDQHYWPGSMSWAQIVERIRSWSDSPVISRDEAYDVAHVAGLLGVFGFPEGSIFQEERRVSERDTKFIGFARALYGEMALDAYMSGEQGHSEEARTQDQLQIIARRVYNLVKRACEDISMNQSDGRLSVEGMLSIITDLTELPKEPQ